MWQNTRQRYERKISCEELFNSLWGSYGSLSKRFYIPTMENYHLIYLVYKWLVQWNIMRLDVVLFKTMGGGGVEV